LRNSEDRGHPFQSIVASHFRGTWPVISGHRGQRHDLMMGASPTV
jgi:hypothetical protein